MWRGALQERGFAIIPGILPRAEIENLLEVLARETPGRTRAGMRHLMSHASVRRLAQDRRLLGIAEDVSGGSALPFRATLFDKSPTANWLVVWHQDTALPLTARCETPGWGPWSVKKGVTYAHAPAHALSRVLALRIHLDDSNSGNGPLRVLPGTHTLGVLTDERIQELATTVSPVECLVSQGGVLAMRPLIVHSSSKSETQTPRRVLHIEYATSGALGNGLELAIA
jgi:ectoine hydroxylase-related dioxygenase (phytanoyl-CoA dioxygenase family)